MPIEELDVNDTLQLKDNSIVVIDNKIIFSTFIKVYNLEIEDNETIMLQKGECWYIMDVERNMSVEHQERIVEWAGSL